MYTPNYKPDYQKREERIDRMRQRLNAESKADKLLAERLVKLTEK